MNKEQVLGIVRHILTFGGGYFTAQGWIDAETWLAISGGLVGAAGLIWSMFFAPEKKLVTPTV